MRLAAITYLYGTCPECSTRAVMTLPSVNRLWLMLPASRARPSLAPDLHLAIRAQLPSHADVGATTVSAHA